MNIEMTERVVKLVGFDAEVTRANKLRQVGVKCGEVVCHCAELEVREARQVGCGSAHLKDSLRSATDK